MAKRDSPLSERMARSLFLDSTVYVDVLRDPSAALFSLVFLTSAVAALGHLGLGFQAAATQFVSGAVLWAASVGVAYYLVSSGSVASGILAERPNIEKIALVLAHANVPRTLLILLFLPLLAGWVTLAFWIVAAVLLLTLVTYAQAIDALFDIGPRDSWVISLIANIPPGLGYVFFVLLAPR